MVRRSVVRYATHRLKLHLFQHRAAEQTVGIAQCLEHFKVVVALADQERHRLACCLYGCGERFDRDNQKKCLTSFPSWGTCLQKMRPSHGCRYESTNPSSV